MASNFACKIVYMSGFAKINHETRGNWDLSSFVEKSFKLTLTYDM